MAPFGLGIDPPETIALAGDGCYGLLGYCGAVIEIGIATRLHDGARDFEGEVCVHEVLALAAVIGEEDDIGWLEVGDEEGGFGVVIVAEWSAGDELVVPEELR